MQITFPSTPQKAWICSVPTFFHQSSNLAVLLLFLTCRQMKSKCLPTAHIKMSTNVKGVTLLFVPPKGKATLHGLAVSHIEKSTWILMLELAWEEYCCEISSQ